MNIGNKLIVVLAVVMMAVFAVNAFAQLSLNQPPDMAVIMSNLSSMPLCFTENLGQWDEKALFRAEAGGATFWFCKDEVVYLFTRDTDDLFDEGLPHAPDIPGMPDKFNHPQHKKESMVLRAQFVGANADAEIIREDRLSHNCNYFLGNDPSKWRTDVPNYSSITYKDIYPGIDLKYHGDGHSMKYDFIINPGADISQILVNYEGTEGLSVSANGDLEARTAFGPINERSPYIYQEIGGAKRQVSGRYFLKGTGKFGFEINGAYDARYPLVIDPELVYSTYLGGDNDDEGIGIAWNWNNNGFVFVTGNTNSDSFPPTNNFPTTIGSYRPTPVGESDVFVTKFAADGSFLVYSTYLGGGRADSAGGIAVDGFGRACVTGWTYSDPFPITTGAYQVNLRGGCDAFVTWLAPDGGSLVYSTYLGGTKNDYGHGIAVDSASGTDQVCITGRTFSSNFPTTLDCFQNYQAIGDTFDNAFMSRISPYLGLIYSTYLAACRRTLS